MRRALSVFTVFAILFFATQYSLKAAPSFDCKAATTAVEVLICENQTLSGQDSQLSATYKRLIELSASQPIDREKLLHEQRQWLGSRSKICSATGKTPPTNDGEKFRATVCLSDLYKLRQVALGQIMLAGDRVLRHLQPDTPDEISVTDIDGRQELKKITSEFQESVLAFFEARGTETASCDTAIDLVIQGAGRDSSYGAHCKVRINTQAVDVLMCNDHMIGKFGIRLSSGSPARDEIVQFVHSVCPPGG